MSDETIPIWGDLLKQRIAELERRMVALETPQEKPASTGNEVASEASAAKDRNVFAASENDGDAEKRRQVLVDLENEIQSVQTRLDRAREEADAAAQQAAEASRRAEDSRAALEARTAAVQVEADKLDQTRRVIGRIWPRFILTDRFAEWKAGIEAALLQETPPPSAALLFANLHGYTACLLEGDQKYLRDVLRDISRFLYAWLKDGGRDEGKAFDIAQAWATAFNEECAGRCEIEVPEPGTPANSLSMTFPPRGSSPDVVSVRTWCVRDAQKRVIHRAEVFT